MDELPRLISEIHWDFDLLQPKIAPGSYEEEQALAAIDAARDTRSASSETSRTPAGVGSHATGEDNTPASSSGRVDHVAGKDTERPSQQLSEVDVDPDGSHLDHAAPLDHAQHAGVEGCDLLARLNAREHAVDHLDHVHEDHVGHLGPVLHVVVGERHGHVGLAQVRTGVDAGLAAPDSNSRRTRSSSRSRFSRVPATYTVS